MKRVLANIGVLLALSISTTGFPLYADSMNMPNGFSSAVVKPVELDAQVISTTSEFLNMEVSLSTESSRISSQLDPNTPFFLAVYYQDQFVKKIPITDEAQAYLGNTLTFSKNTPMKLALEFPLNKLNIPYGDYELQLHAKLKENTVSLASQRLPFRYFSDVHYVPALGSIQNNQTALTLHFIDNEYNHLIPITRIIPYTTTPLRATIENLEAGPTTQLGLFEASPIPKGAKLSLHNRTANVYLSKDLGGYDQGSSASFLAVGSFVESLASIPQVDQIQFYFDNQIVGAAFHDMVMDEPYRPYKGPKAYVAYITNTGRTLLMPQPLYNESISMAALFQRLKYDYQFDLFHSTIQPTVPQEVELIHTEIEKNVAKLLLNEAFLSAYGNDQDQQLLMIESILYTFTSLEGIDYVQFEVEGNDLSTPFILELGKPIKPSPYINPEL